MIQEEARGIVYESSLLFTHAQDHLMTSMLARELITELIELHEKLKA